MKNQGNNKMNGNRRRKGRRKITKTKDNAFLVISALMFLQIMMYIYEISDIIVVPHPALLGRAEEGLAREQRPPPTCGLGSLGLLACLQCLKDDARK